MSSPAIVRNVLANAAAVTAVVPGVRIFAGTIPQGSTLPAIGVRLVSGVERTTVSMAEASRYRTDRVQVTVHAKTYATKCSILELVRTALSPKRGTVNGFDVDSITPDGEGPDFDDDAAVIYERSRDFMVTWRT